MYHFIKEKEKVLLAQNFASELMNSIQDEVRKAGISCQFFLIGSGARSMVTQNANEPFDFDYNINVLSCEDWNDCRAIKETIRKACNISLRHYGLRDIQDSTSALTTYVLQLKQEPDVLFSIDIGIVTEDDKGIWNRLIHDKNNNRYYWNEVKNSKDVSDKVNTLKKHYHWSEVRERYIVIKNKYLKQNDHNHPSFICYIEAVNEIYQKWGDK